MQTYFQNSVHLRDLKDAEINFDGKDIKIGWKDKNSYFFVTDIFFLKLPSTWYLDFIFLIQNKKILDGKLVII